MISTVETEAAFGCRSTLDVVYWGMEPEIEFIDSAFRHGNAKGTLYRIWHIGKEGDYRMELQYTYWQNDGWYLGYLDDYPDHMTQGKNLKELEEMLKSLYDDFSSDLTGVKRKGKLIVA